MPGTRTSDVGSGLAGRGVAGHRVVVGQRHHVQAGLGGPPHHLGRRVGPVGGAAVHMQIGPHQGAGRRGAGRRGDGAPKGRSRSWPGSRRSRRPIGSRSRTPAVSGHSTTHSQCALDLAGEHRAARGSDRPEREIVLAERDGGGRRRGHQVRPGVHRLQAGQRGAQPEPGFLGDHEHARPGPPIGFGPDRATAQARIPVRSSPAPAKPVTSQPPGSGQGSQTGTSAVRSRPSRPSRDGLKAGSSGCTSPCRSQRQALDQAVGSRRGWPQRGQARPGHDGPRAMLTP